MIRPRIGSFVYNESELATMSWDIDAFWKEGVKGLVFGCLNGEGEVDMRAVHQ